MRTPFCVKVYDADLKEHRVTVWLDLPDPPEGVDGWDAVAWQEREAAEEVKANLEIDIDVEALCRGEAVSAPWHLTARPAVTLLDRLRLVCGVPLYVRFNSPDGECHAACDITASVQRDWPSGAVAGGWPPLTRPLPPPPDIPSPDTDSGVR